MPGTTSLYKTSAMNFLQKMDDAMHLHLCVMGEFGASRFAARKAIDTRSLEWTQRHTRDSNAYDAHLEKLIRVVL